MFLILLQWLLSLTKSVGKTPPIILAYDNMCNIDRLHVAQSPLPLPSPYNGVWLGVKKIIDVFHFKNHVSPRCRELYSPAEVKESHPNFNTQAGEQTFSWVSRFSHILCAMNKTHHLFYLHRMVIRRNMYTSRCHLNGKKPLLPKCKKIDKY